MLRIKMNESLVDSRTVCCTLNVICYSKRIQDEELDKMKSRRGSQLLNLYNVFSD